MFQKHPPLAPTQTFPSSNVINYHYIAPDAINWLALNLKFHINIVLNEFP